MRRITGLLPAALLISCVVLAGALAPAGASAGATAPAPALNRYATTVTEQQSARGTTAAPVPLGLSQTLAVRPLSGVNAAAITSLSLTLGDVRAAPGHFPTCTVAQIDAAGTDTGCPADALVASATVASALWSPAEPAVAADLPCYEHVDIFNAGGDRLAAFLTIPAGHWCDDLQTGDITAWAGRMTVAGSGLRVTLPLPPAVSTDTGGTGLETAVDTLSLRVRRLSAAVGDHSVGFLASTGCRRGHRSLLLTVTANASAGGAAQSTGLHEDPGC